jgi:ribose transport system substrate-binding protein
MSSVRKSHKIVAASGLVVAALALSACGGSSSGGSPQTNGGSSAATGSGGSTSAAVKAAQALVAKYEQPATKITQTVALPSAPPKGKTFVWLNCDIVSCTSIGDGIKAAIEAGGWNFKEVNYQSANPATLTAAFKQALTLHPTVVGESGVPPEAGWASVEPQYKAAGVPIITNSLGPTQTNATVLGNVGGPPSEALYAKMVAAWFTADSNGQGKALIERVDAYPVLKSYSDYLVSDIKTMCPNCDISATVQNSAAQVGSNGIVPSVVSALKRDPSIKYFLPCDLEFFDSLPSALSAAGLSVKTSGQNPDVASMGFLKSGKFAAIPAKPLSEGGWAMADIAFRTAMGLPLVSADTGSLPSSLLTPSSSFSTTSLTNLPTDYPTQFEKLWHVG